MPRFGRMQKQTRRAGAGECRGHLARDEAGFADSGGDQPARLALATDADDARDAGGQGRLLRIQALQHRRDGGGLTGEHLTKTSNHLTVGHGRMVASVGIPGKSWLGIAGSHAGGGPGWLRSHTAPP